MMLMVNLMLTDISIVNMRAERAEQLAKAKALNKKVKAKQFLFFLTRKVNIGAGQENKEV